MKKKLIALLMAIVLMGGVAGALPAQAAQISEEEATEKILYLKELFGIGDEYCNFEQNIWDDSDGQRWSFSWYDANYNKSIYINVDDKNHVSSFSCYDDTTYLLADVPKDYPEHYEAIAMEGIKKYLPELADHIKLDRTTLEYYSNNYVFRYVRFENGYPMPDNYVSVSVNHVTEKIQSFYTGWNYNVKIAKPGKIIDKKTAASKLDKNLEMELQYVYRQVDKKEEAFLAYAPSTGYLSVDAETGKVYTEKTYWGEEEEYTNDTTAADMKTEAAAGERGVSLSEAEMKKVKEMASLISKEEAIAVVTSNKDLLLDSGLKQTNAYLTGYNDEYFWEITMSDPRPVDYSTDDYWRAYANATVDAKNGKLLSFRASLREYYEYADAKNVEFKYNKTQAAKKFEKFAKALEPEKFAQTKKTASDGGYVIYYDYSKDLPVYGGQNLVFTRLVNGIPFYRNSITGAVDRVTGKVYSYNVNWNDKIEFPSADNTISAKDAFDKYLESDEFVLKYELTTNTKMDKETYVSITTTKPRLCYVTEIKAPYVDAITGKFLNYIGEEYKPVSKNRTFSDIVGHKYEKEIRFISQLFNGIEGDKFEPDSYVTNKFLAEVFQNMWYFSRTPQNLKSDNKNVKREDLANVIAEALGYKSLTKLDIFNVSFKDADKISADCKAAVAICSGLKIFDVKSTGKFKPAGKVTRGELAAVLAKALVAERNK